MSKKSHCGNCEWMKLDYAKASVYCVAGGSMELAMTAGGGFIALFPRLVALGRPSDCPLDTTTEVVDEA